MNSLAYFDTGEKYFNTGHPIFVNLHKEPVKTHIHAHDFIEISYVSSGRGIHMIGEREYEVKKGDLFLINYNIPHEFRSLPELYDTHPLVINNCVFKPEFIDSTMAESKSFYDIAKHLLFRSLFPSEMETNIDFKLIDVDTKDIEEIYKKINKEFNLKEDGYIELLRLYVTELMIIIFRTMRKAQHTPTKDSNGNMAIVEKILDHLKGNYCKALNLQDLSMLVFLSPAYISRLFKDFTGLTLTDYIQTKRIEEACRLLHETDKKIVAIAEEVGYKDLKHFQQVFKKITGTTPSLSRRKKVISKNPSFFS
jgi:AraC family L-rhamnose operon transcriptional activator RhaR